jgi:SAM-dependent methyltransferase
MSGVGSNLDQTRELINLLPSVLQGLGVNSLLDIPCGDFNWMSQINYPNIKYTGADIVLPLVQHLNSKFGSSNRDFMRLNLVLEIPGKFDAVFSRDLLVHLNNTDALGAIRNVIASESSYFLTTTFPALKSNRDLPIITREIAWRPLNLELSPFNFPAPLLLINEKCSESNGEFADKSIGVWKISDLVSVFE